MEYQIVNGIDVTMDFVIASPYDGGMMDKSQHLEGGIMDIDKNLENFQYNLDVAVGRCFHSRNSWVSGLRFSANGIVVNIHVNDDVDDYVVIPYSAFDATIDDMSNVIQDILELRKIEEKKKAEKLKKEEEDDERSVYERLRKKFNRVD